MATKILGKVVITPKGEFNEATTYQKLDVVSYQGSSYICLQETTGNLPTNTEYWQLIAQKGTDGVDGKDGTNGIDGKDGQDGVSATIQIGTVTTLEAEQNATVTNVGTSTNAIFNFGIPKGQDGEDATDSITSSTITSISVVDELPSSETNGVLYLVKESTTTSSTTNTVQASEVVNTPASTEPTVDNAEVTDTPTSTDTTETEVS